MRNLIVFSGIILMCKFGFGQQILTTDTLHFAADSSYSRIVARYSKNELLFGTSKTGVILFNEKTGLSRVLIQPAGCGEFRDLVVSGKSVYACTSGDCGIIYEANGKKVRELYRDNSFMDDLVLKDRSLIILSDPVDNAFTLKVLDVRKGFVHSHGPFKTVAGEAYYAASGTTAQLMDGVYYVVSGGPNNATFYKRSTFEYVAGITSELPMPHAEGAGPFSIFMIDKQNGVIAGGNYTKPHASDSTAVYTTNGGKTWNLSEKQPHGYRSCVTGNSTILFCCGTNGIDYSTDNGKTWNFFTKGNFCALLLEGNTLYATTNKGYALKYQLKMEN
ncbi:sialidase family protein [Fluviicola sp.]|uniref:sialidase family protein n=1 Tax=Fluviicola sp. TaxID=1917219 RepID=UPI0031D3915D